MKKEVAVSDYIDAYDIRAAYGYLKSHGLKYEDLGATPTERVEAMDDIYMIVRYGSAPDRFIPGYAVYGFDTKAEAVRFAQKHAQWTKRIEYPDDRI